MIISKYRGSIRSSIKPFKFSSKELIALKEGYITEVEARDIIVKKDK